MNFVLCFDLTVNSTKRLIKKKALAEMFSVSGRTVDTWVLKRMVPFIRVNSRLNLFDPEKVEAALTKHEVEAVAE